MGDKGWLRDHFHFSGKERTGLGVLLLAIGLVYAAPLFLPSASSAPIVTLDSSLTIGKVSTEASRHGTSNAHAAFYRNPKHRDYPLPPKGPFDPNSLDDKDWQELGLREKTVRTLRNFLNAGGRFRKPEDLKRIYGLHQEDYARLAPYVRIMENREPPIIPVNEAPRPPYIKRALPILDLNKADSSDLEALPGIGPRLASRILLFRERLGGFYDVNQLSETFGLPDSVFHSLRDRFRVAEDAIRKIKINQATDAELAQHPYIRWPVARAITAFRKERGPFRSAHDLQKVLAINPEQLNKLLPYLIWD